MRGRLAKVEEALAKIKTLGLSKGVHWTDLNQEDLRSVGLGGDLRFDSRDKKSRYCAEYKGKNYKVSELRQLLRERGLCDSGKRKRLLIERLQQFDQLLDRVDRFKREEASNTKEEDTENTNVVSNEEEMGDETGDEMGVSEEEDTGGALVTGNKNEHYGSLITDKLVSRGMMDALMTPADVEPLGSDREACDKPQSAAKHEEDPHSYAVMQDWRDLSITEELEEATQRT
jgi:hypothetical protein